MENFKFGLVSVIILAGLGLLGYWAFATLEPGDIHAYKEKQQALEERNRELLKENAELKSRLGSLEAEKEETVSNDEPARADEKPSSTTAYKYQSLINELQKLIADNIFMKVGSRGTRVGTVQNFLNIYNKTSKKVDNDYGAGTKTDVANFQKAVGLAADGETGPATYQKMVDWLKKQG